MIKRPSLSQWMHVVWFTHDGLPLLNAGWRDEFFAALEAQGREAGVYVDLARGMDNHVHVLLQLTPAQSLAPAVNRLMAESATWLRAHRPESPTRLWAPGYAASSVSPDRIPMLRRHLRRQEQVHSQVSLMRELWELDLHARDTQCVVVGMVNGPIPAPRHRMPGRVWA